MNLLHKNPETEAQEAAQRRAVLKRDGKGCRFERKIGGVWRECGSKDEGTCAHIIRRAQAAKAWAHPDVGLRGCWSCHRSYDNELLAGEPRRIVRVPYDRAKLAWQIVCAASKSIPYARYNPDNDSELYAEPTQKKREAA